MTTKTKLRATCYFFYESWGGRGRGQTGRHPGPNAIAWLYSGGIWVAIQKQQFQPAFTTVTTAGRCKAPPVQLERGFGMLLSHSPDQKETGKRGNKKTPAKTKKCRSSFKKDFSIFGIFIDFSNTVQRMQICNQNHAAK